MANPDAVVVGAGPNGLAAGIVLAQAGLSVEVYERHGDPGGSCRTEELTLGGFLHDVCAAVHPLAAASPFMADLDLAGRGVRWLQPEIAFAHPLDGGRAGAVYPSLSRTAAGLGRDASWYRSLMEPMLEDWPATLAGVLAPVRGRPHHPRSLARFGVRALPSARWLTRRCTTPEARALLAGAAAHAGIALEAPLSGGFGVLLSCLAHVVGWPLVEGGSARLIKGLVGALTSGGGSIQTGHEIRSLGHLPPAVVTLLDLTPRQLLALDDGRIPSAYRRSLARFRYGPGACKVDWALAGPVPWSAPECAVAGTVHVGGTLEEVALAERQVLAGHLPDRPFVLVAQPSVVDASRAPPGCHSLWGYCHVPAGSPVDMSERIERQIERFAPGFRQLMLARHVRTAAQAELDNPNQVGGDVNGGSARGLQALLRPTARWHPYRTPMPGLYLCSAATPPGGGVHGMCGAQAARAALARVGRQPQRWTGDMSA